MKTKEAIQYIKSKAMREHLQKVGYEPSVLEAAAFLMSTVRERSFAEQQFLLLGLVLENEAAALEGGDDSVAAMIHEYIEKTEKFMKEFETAKPGEYYMYFWKESEKDDENYCTMPEFTPIYSTIEKCADAAFEEYVFFEMGFRSNGYNTLKIVKRRINDEGYYRAAFYKGNPDVVTADGIDFCCICDTFNEFDIKLLNILDKENPKV